MIFLQTLFDNMQAKTDAAIAKKKPAKPKSVEASEGAEPMQIDGENGAKEGAKKDNKRLSVERIYQKKSQLEHILLRPDTYIGSVESVTQVGYASNLEIMLLNYPCYFLAYLLHAW